MQPTSFQNFVSTEIRAWMRTRPEVRVGIHASPLGSVVIASVEGRLSALSFCREEADGFADVAARLPGAALVRDDALAHETGREIFRGSEIRMPSAGLAMIGTDFQLSVWEHLMDIPSGSVATYSDIASGIGRPQAIRAVATAIGRNPIALLVPCHRIVPLAGGIGEYRWGRERKSNLIARESMAATLASSRCQRLAE
jgi:AraC family transcriptional regulator of adaptative response/methylated-DNA-[protein]-cysteine methyltransferase